MRPQRAQVQKKSRLAKEIYSLVLRAPMIAQTANPGQFIQIRVNDGLDPFLRRPLSIAGREDDRLEVVFKIRGRGTRILAEKKRGDDLDIIGPLGRPIPSLEKKKILLIGGGVGAAPLRFLSQTAAKTNRLYFILGAKTEEELILCDDIKGFVTELVITTEDGSTGYKGLATDRLEDIVTLASPDLIFACGPEAMLKAVKMRVPEIPTYGFFEGRMGCGFGLCLGCALKKKTGGYLRICMDGPVFSLAEVEL